ncbi:MAG: hypothetical protein U1E53_05345 [Dongiaceae bacterium]
MRKLAMLSVVALSLAAAVPALAEEQQEGAPVAGAITDDQEQSQAKAGEAGEDQPELMPGAEEDDDGDGE